MSQKLQPNKIDGGLSAAGLRFGIVVSRFNSFITERLYQGAMDALARSGADPNLVALIRVPGSWAVPLVAAELARQHRYDAIICLACVIRGETPHFDYVAGEAASGVTGRSSLRGRICLRGGRRRRAPAWRLP